MESLGKKVRVSRGWVRGTGRIGSPPGLTGPRCHPVFPRGGGGALPRPLCPTCPLCKWAVCFRPR